MKLFKKLLFLMFSACSTWAFATTPLPTYNISTLLDMSVNSDFANKNCPLINENHTCYVAGSARDLLGNIYVSMVVPKGQIFKITPAGKASLFATFDIGNQDPTTIDNNYVGFRVTTDALANLYVSFRSVDNAQNPTDMNGVWRIPAGGGRCALDSSNTCTKIFPQIGQTTTPVLRFVDGITLDGFGHVYLADAQMGNIWKINVFTKNGALWAGTDAGSSPNYLGGNPINILLGSPLSGRGFGVVGLDYDLLKNVLYGTNFDTGSVIGIPVNKNGSAGTQTVLLNLSGEDKQLEAIYIVNELPTKTRRLVVAHTLTNFIGFSKFLGCQQNIPGFCPAPFALPANGQEILSAKLDDPNGIQFQSLINDPQLQGPASVVNGSVLKSRTLYINALGQLDASGSKILKATPAN